MDKKSSNMVTRSMGEGALFSLFMLLVITYIMYTYGYYGHSRIGGLA